MQYYKQHKKGIIGTVIFHVIVLILLIFFGFFTPLPLPGEEGILVSFGASYNGFGEIEPSPAQNSREATQQVQQAEREAVPTPPQTTPPSSVPRQETVVTQDNEQTAAIDAAERARREEAERRQIQLEEERRRQQEIDRQRIAEAERINEINSRTQGAFNNSEAGGQGAGTSQGVTFPAGNQGAVTGDPNAGSQGGSGLSSQGSGVSFSLAGRSAMSLPLPDYPENEEGVVIVSITVDRNGNVTAAETGARGTTIINYQFWNEARQAALKAKFSVNEDVPEQRGTITYRFVPK